MRQIISILLACIVATVSFNAPAQEYNKECYKMAQKQAKAKAKELKKRGYTCISAYATEDALTQAYMKGGPCGNYELKIEPANGVADETTGQGIAEDVIANSIAKSMFQAVAGASALNIQSTQKTYAENKMKGLYEGEIKGCIERELTFSKRTMNGNYDVQVVFLLNKARMEQLRNKAIRDFDGDRWDAILKDVDSAHGK